MYIKHEDFSKSQEYCKAKSVGTTRIVFKVCSKMVSVRILKANVLRRALSVPTAVHPNQQMVEVKPAPIDQRKRLR